MSECQGLNKYTPYNLGWVKHDETADTYIAQIINPPAACKEGIFVTKKGELRVSTSVDNAQLTYTDHPIITVRNESLVQVVNPQSHFMSYLFFTLLFATVCYLIYRFFSSQQQLQQQTSYAYPSGTGVSAYAGHGATASTPAVPGGTTVINNNNGSSNDGFVTGMLVGNMLSGGGRSHDTTIIEKTTIVERDAPSTPPSPSDDSYSGDSSSDFGSDSGSSDFGSDSGSDFGSDSGSSFGGDSGGDSGGSFGSDD